MGNDDFLEWPQRCLVGTPYAPPLSSTGGSITLLGDKSDLLLYTVEGTFLIARRNAPFPDVDMGQVIALEGRLEPTGDLLEQCISLADLPEKKHPIGLVILHTLWISGADISSVPAKPWSLVAGEA